jgi:fructose 1,6-bisphosphate aldolase/phosphatase
MKTTISVIKADVGSIGGHIKPSSKLKQTVEQFVREKGKKLLMDVYVSSTGDDVALLMSHDRGIDDPKIHELAWDAFMAGTKVAREQGLYGAGQDLLKDAFSVRKEGHAATGNGGNGRKKKAA